MVNAGTAATAEPNGRFAPAAIDVEGIEGRINSSLLKRVQKLVDDHPDRALEVIRAWLFEPTYH
jgi:flagellar biosynthesis/type III secretory pathway M-ring protein FliF/YscJ